MRESVAPRNRPRVRRIVQAISIALVVVGLAIGAWLAGGIALVVLIPGVILFCGVALFAAGRGFDAGTRAAATRVRASSSSGKHDNRR